MIKIETLNSENPSVKVEGSGKIICTELMIVITKLIENDVLKEEDRNIIKLITSLNREDAIEAKKMLLDSLNLINKNDKSEGTKND